MLRNLRSLLSSLLGDLSWTPPAWLALASRPLLQTVRQHRGTSVAMGLLLVGLAGGAWPAWNGYRHRPKPVTISLRVRPPGVTPLAKELIPQPLLLEFGASVARLDQLGTTPRNGTHSALLQGIHIDPPIAGAWRWTSDRQLTFSPKSDWPADQKYRVTLERSLFAPHVLLAQYEVETRTPAFVATMPKLEFYTDPTDPAVKQVVATFEFTHRVDAVELERRLRLALVGASPVFKKDAPQFALTLGQQQRVAYLRTSALILPEQEDFMRVTLAKGLPTIQGGAVTAAEVEQKVRVPDLYSFFRITSAKGTIVRTLDGEPEQVVLITGTTAAKSEDVQKAVRVYLLPKKSSKSGADAEENARWTAPEEIDEAVLAQATLLPVKLIPSGQENSEVHSFKISVESRGQLFVSVGKGTRALGGFVLGADFRAVLMAPEWPREIEIQGEGGVLALNGERKLSIKSRGVRTIEYEIARVPADQINHLVSQTRGEFQNPEFVNYHFGRENMARLATERQSIAAENEARASYSAFDFTKHLRAAEDGGSAMQGLFFLTAREWHPPKKNASEGHGNEESSEGGEEEDSDAEGHLASTSRFILVTDLGLIVKEDADGSREIFLASIKTGEPLSGVSVDVLGKNGVPLVNGATGPDGRVDFPSLGLLTREKKPIAFVARYGSDVAFMPYAREDRQLDFSRFETGGVESRSGAELDAFVFTERGIYRPGDEMHIGLLVKQRDWAGKLEGLPVETEIIDARGTSVQVRKLALPAGGFAETSYQTAYESPTGDYAIHVYLVRDGKRDLLLGETSVTVKEFLPDRLKIESHLSRETKAGWVSPGEMHAAVSLRNLYGTPATSRRLKAHLALSPAGFRFEEFGGFTFFDRLQDAKKEVKWQELDLGEQKTSDTGAADFELGLERFADATYAMTFCVEGFEADGGRSVTTSNSLLVSSAPYVIGAKPDGDFRYVPMGSARTVQWIALDPALKKIAVEDLECRLIEHRYLSVLSKKEDGDYAYESVLRDQLLRTEEVHLAVDGLGYSLPTEVPGDFVLELHERKTGARVSQVSFSVIGRGTVSRSLEKNAELQVKLSRADYQTGDDLEISIVAPYTGSGLITIERDKVYAHTWFKADRTSTVQHIRVPADFEGTGYVNVCFVRALDSQEVFMSPLSYAAIPFTANIEKRRLPITLRAAAKSLPGEPLRIGYKTDRPARIVLFAVDRGILQVSGYQLPEPLAHFYRKAALMVQTKQIVDLILPEFSILRNASAFGGDGERHLNPFQRVTEKPVVFWSGVLEAGPREQEVVYEVPDYFSGTLSIMAVAMSADAAGSAEMNSLIRGPFVLSPNVPTVAAPGDRFEVSVTVANGVEGSGTDAEVRVSAECSEHLEIVQSPANPLQISEGREVSATFTIRAREKFGAAHLVFRASTGGQESQLRSTLSVRPAVPFVTSVRSGNFTKESAEVQIERSLHPDFRKLEATIAALPLGLARGLDFYLQHYPNGCSEQLASGAFCRLLLADEADFGLSRREISAQLERTFATLRSRQNDQGSFGYWAADGNDGIDFVSAYVVHFLIEAKAAGFAPPPTLLQNGLRHLQAMVVLEPHDLAEARTQAYAIYLLTREAVITTNHVLNLRDTLDRKFAKQWPADLTSVYLAGACALLKKCDDAQRLLRGYPFGKHRADERSDFYSPLGAEAQYLAIVARHFPELLPRITAADFEAITRPIGEGSFSTLSAAYAVLALKAYSHQLAQKAPELGMAERVAKHDAALPAEGSALLQRAAFSADATALRFTAKNAPRGLGAFFQVVEAGYDTVLPTHAQADGIEVFRDFLDARGAVTHTARLGEPLTVRLRLRSLRERELTNIAIVDLLPGGFEFAAGSLRPGVGSAGFDYVEMREDRAVFFGTIGPRVREVIYQIKPTNRGEFVVPPTFAESMYDRSISACALAGRITVTDAP